MAGAVLGGSLSQFPLGRFSDRMDRRKVLIATAARSDRRRPGDHRAAAAHAGPGRSALVVVFGAMIYPMYALAVAHANDFATADEFVKIAGGLLLLLGFGMMLGPIIAAVAMDRLMPEGLFVFTALVHLLLALYTLYRMSRRAAPARRPRQLPGIAAAEDRDPGKRHRSIRVPTAPRPRSARRRIRRPESPLPTSPLSHGCHVRPGLVTITVKRSRSMSRASPAASRNAMGTRADMEYFLQQLINGLTLGSIYGLIAIGYTMVYGIIGMINFAHGDIFMVGSFLALIALILLGVTAATPIASSSSPR